MYQVGRVNCRKFWEICRKFYVNKFLVFYVFKRSGGYEIYYGIICLLIDLYLIILFVFFDFVVSMFYCIIVKKVKLN